MAFAGPFSSAIGSSSRAFDPPSNCCCRGNKIRKLSGDKERSLPVGLTTRICVCRTSPLIIRKFGGWMVGVTAGRRVSGLPIVTVPSGFIIRTCWGWTAGGWISWCWLSWTWKEGQWVHLPILYSRLNQSALSWYSFQGLNLGTDKSVQSWIKSSSIIEQSCLTEVRACLLKLEVTLPIISQIYNLCKDLSKYEIILYGEIIRT